MNIQEIENQINKVPDYPKPGILFYDISSLIINNQAFSATISLLADLVKKFDFNSVAAIDARGFIFGSALAHKLGLGLVMIRKKGKLPGKVITQSYELEYGTNSLSIQKLNLENKSIVIIDDLLATGGSMQCSKELLESLGANVVGGAVVIELTSLKGSSQLNMPIISLISYAV